MSWAFGSIYACRLMNAPHAILKSYLKVLGQQHNFMISFSGRTLALDCDLCMLLPVGQF